MKRLLNTLFLLLVACDKNTSSPTKNSLANTTENITISQISVADLYAKQKQQDIIIIDVRTPAEYQQGHVPKTQNIPLQELSSRINELEAWKTEEIHLICAIGGRSQKAAMLLANQGFLHPLNVQGGTSAWKAAGYPQE